MSGKYTKDGLRSKVEWEGGVAEAITSYGIHPEHLPDETPTSVRVAWERVYRQARDDIDFIEAWLEREDS